MTNQEIKLLQEIETIALDHINKKGFVPYQVTVSCKQYKIYTNLTKQGYKATVTFNGIKWALNVKPCQVLLAAIDNTFGMLL